MKATLKHNQYSIAYLTEKVDNVSSDVTLTHALQVKYLQLPPQHGKLYKQPK